MASTGFNASSRFLTFWVGTNRYALAAAGIAEVIRIRAMARVPQGPPALMGVTNLRGIVAPVIGLRELLQQGASQDGAEKLCLVLDHASPTALVIDSVESLEDVPPEQVEQADPAWQNLRGEKIQGAFKSGSSAELTKILDIDALLTSAFAERYLERQRARAASGISTRIISEQLSHPTEMLLTFEVAGQEFALPLPAVDKLVPLPPLVSAVSRPDSVVLGFTSIRETLIPLLSLRGLLGFEPPVRSTGREKVLTLKVAGSPVGLVIDDARAVIAARCDFMEPVPAVLLARTGGESRIRAVYRGERGKHLISILSPELLFREDVMQRLTKTEHHVPIQADAVAGVVAEEAIFLAFRLGNDEFGLPIGSVVEVAHVPAQVTRVPKAPKFLDGVVNVRGEVLPVIDQRRRFEMPILTDQTRRLIVVQAGQLRAGIIVDSVTDLLRTDRSAILPPPQLTAQISRLVHGMVNLEAVDRLVLLLNPAELLTPAEQSLLDTFRSQSRKVRA